MPQHKFGAMKLLLEEDTQYEILLTSHGYIILEWSSSNQNLESATYCSTPEVIKEVLLDDLAGYLEYRTKSGECRDVALPAFSNIWTQWLNHDGEYQEGGSMWQGHILIVKSNIARYQRIREQMSAMGMNVDYAEQSTEALAKFIQQEYSLVMIEVHTFDQSDVKLVQQMRQAKPTPIIILSAALPPESKLSFLQAGTNAFLEEPFDIDVCIAQAYAFIHLHIDSHTDDWKSAVIYGTELIISRHYRQVLIDGKPLELTRKEFDLFYFFANHPGQVFSYGQLYQQVWNEETAQGSDDTVKSHIKTLRKKLASVGKVYIKNVWGIGYKFNLSPS